MHARVDACPTSDIQNSLWVAALSSHSSCGCLHGPRPASVLSRIRFGMVFYGWCLYHKGTIIYDPLNLHFSHVLGFKTGPKPLIHIIR